MSTILATSIEPYISEMVRNHQEQVREWQETVHIDQPLHHHLVAVFDDEYLQGFHNIHTDYVGITTQHIVEYLYTKYDLIRDVDIEDNDIKMRETHNPSFPIEIVFHQIEVAV